MSTLFRGGSRPFLFFALAVVVATAARGEIPCNRATTLIVVRHADRAGAADSLSAAGVERAQALARALARSGVTAIYHSDTARTRLTAEPLARALGIEPVELPGKDVDGLLKDVFANHCGGTVLIVGHSNTVPMIVAAAGGPVKPDLPENKYNDLFVLSLTGRKATLVELQYGAGTP